MPPTQAIAYAKPSPRGSKQPHTAGRHGKIGLALAGGGPLGGIYEVGALLALADSLDGLDFNELDVYVGVSSGGFVAAALANGISPAQMYRLFIDDGVDAALKPEIFLRPAFAEFGRCLTALPGLAAACAPRLPARSVAARRGGIGRNARPGNSHRRVRQPRHRHLSDAAFCRAGAHQRFSQALPASFTSWPPTSIRARR